MAGGSWTKWRVTAEIIISIKELFTLFAMKSNLSLIPLLICSFKFETGISSLKTSNRAWCCVTQ